MSVLYDQCVIDESDVIVGDNESIVGKKDDSRNRIAIYSTLHLNSDAQRKTLSCSYEAKYLSRDCVGGMREARINVVLLITDVSVS